MTAISITRTRHRLLPDARRVLAKPYLPGEETLLPGQSRAHLLMARVLAIPEADVEALNARSCGVSRGATAIFAQMLERQFDARRDTTSPALTAVSAARRLLIGAYFTHEYSIEAAALFNPSIVPAPDQSGLASGAMRFVMSLRAVGEGHLSSIEFRSGVLDADGGIAIDDAGHAPGRRPANAAAATSTRRASPPSCSELGAINDLSSSVLNRLAPQFTLEELEASLSGARGPRPAAGDLVRDRQDHSRAGVVELRDHVPGRLAARRARDLPGRARTRRAAWKTHASCCSRTIDGSTKYYATYTAYDGFSILPQLIETEDFVRFTISTLNGAAAQNKGMALFPRTDRRQVRHAVAQGSREPPSCRRRATCTTGTTWPSCTGPQHPWELLQIGNCGSPIETRGRLARAHARRGPDAPLRDRRDAARPRGSAARDRPFAGAAHRARRGRARRLRAERRVHLRRHRARRASSSCRTGSPTPASRSRTSRSTTCSRRCLPADRRPSLANSRPRNRRKLAPLA